MFAGLAVWLVSALAAPAGAQTATAPPVLVQGGPATTREFGPACSDVHYVGVQERLSFVLHRGGSTAGPLVVPYRLSGTAQPGVHYERLPGWVLFPPGQPSVTVPVTPRQTSWGAVVDLTLEAVPSGSRATITFVSPPSPGPHECGYRFTADPWNGWQSVPVGGTPHALTLEQNLPPEWLPAAGRFRVTSGRLPDGVALAPDGTFTGRAATPGSYLARVEACRPGPPGTCVTTTLIVVVTSGPAPALCSPWLPPQWRPAC
ncbi:MAG: hypothetical protein ACLGI2_13570 [Acidimicrobiia bacterium]